MAAAVVPPFEVTFSLRVLKDLSVSKLAKAILPWAACKTISFASFSSHLILKLHY